MRHAHPYGGGDSQRPIALDAHLLNQFSHQAALGCDSITHCHANGALAHFVAGMDILSHALPFGVLINMN
jgi:hypothetical protein